VEQSLVSKSLGQQEYVSIWHAMQQFTEQRTDTTPDEIWSMTHLPVFTQGQAGKAEHVLNAGDIPVVKVDRGGQVTYHGPGQLVIYTLLDIQRLGLHVRPLVCALESALIAMLKDFDITAQQQAGAPGVYVGTAKIASVGLRIRRGRCYHGVSVNVDMDLAPFERINPCGYAGLQMTQMVDFVKGITCEWVAARLSQQLCQHLGYTQLSI
jgi:lipoyl(octanoyl) transferase